MWCEMQMHFSKGRFCFDLCLLTCLSLQYSTIMHIMRVNLDISLES